MEDMMTTEEEADYKTAWMLDSFHGNWHNRWSILGYLINKGELDIVLSPMAMTISWLS